MGRAPVPANPTLPSLRAAAAGCRACPLWVTGTQTVFGEGAPAARVIMIGEQPGDQEDKLGRPFVGPAGRLLDKALGAAGISRGDVYLTNVVKHFKWQERGKRRIHQKPDADEIGACLPWLEAEIEVVRPRLLVCLGATAAQALLGRAFRVTKERGRIVDSRFGIPAIATVHPSSILRAPEDEMRRRETELFVDDLRRVAAALAGLEQPWPDV
jgi:DNA polymerase